MTIVSLRERNWTLHQDDLKKFFTVSEINNESQLYNIVNVVGVVSNISDDVLVEKDGVPLHFKKVQLSDDGDSVPLTLFNAHQNSVNEEKAFSFTNLRVSKFDRVNGCHPK